MSEQQQPPAESQPAQTAAPSEHVNTASAGRSDRDRPGPSDEPGVKLLGSAAKPKPPSKPPLRKRTRPSAAGRRIGVARQELVAQVINRAGLTPAFVTRDGRRWSAVRL